MDLFIKKSYKNYTMYICEEVKKKSLIKDMDAKLCPFILVTIQ